MARPFGCPYSKGSRGTGRSIVSTGRNAVPGCLLPPRICPQGALMPYTLHGTFTAVKLKKRGEVNTCKNDSFAFWCGHAIRITSVSTSGTAKLLHDFVLAVSVPY